MMMARVMVMMMMMVMFKAEEGKVTVFTNPAFGDSKAFLGSVGGIFAFHR